MSSAPAAQGAGAANGDGCYRRPARGLCPADHPAVDLYAAGAVAAAIATLIFMMSGRITRWVRRSGPRRANTRNSPPAAVSFSSSSSRFIIGYFGAGAGILILAMLALLGMDHIHTMNALKAWLTTVSNGVAMVLFAVTPHVVYWRQAVLMIIGAIAGGYFGAYFARKTKPEHVRAIVIVIGFTLAAYFFVRQIRGYSCSDFSPGSIARCRSSDRPA